MRVSAAGHIKHEAGKRGHLARKVGEDALLDVLHEVGINADLAHRVERRTFVPR